MAMNDPCPDASTLCRWEMRFSSSFPRRVSATRASTPTEARTWASPSSPTSMTRLCSASRIAEAWLAASWRIWSRESACATARLRRVSCRSRATAGRSALILPLVRPALLDMHPAAAEPEGVHLLVVVAGSGLIDADVAPEALAPVHFEKNQVVTEVAQASEGRRGSGASQRALSGVFQHQ